MSAMDWSATPERRALADAINQMCANENSLQLLLGSGIPWIGIDDSLGGSGGDLADAVTAVRTLAENAHGFPIAETSLSAGWALTLAGLPVPQELLAPAFELSSKFSLTQTNDEFALTGVAHDVPGLDHAKFIVIPVDSWVCLVLASDVSVTTAVNVAHERRDTISLRQTPIQAMGRLPEHLTPNDLLARLAFARAVQLSGALISVRDISIEFAKTRQQFGKPIASLQIIAHYLAELAELALVGEGAIATALASPSSINFAVAKSVTGRAARDAARIAHQIHGAMGMSEEYVLGKFTTRMWAWIEEAGRPEFWNVYIGQEFLAHSDRNLWTSITDGIESERA